MAQDDTASRFAELARLVEASDLQDRWLVLTHDNPDPDALASAVLLSHLLREHFGRKVTTAYGGLIGRAENREMVRALKLNFSHLRNLSFKNYAHFALVDTQPQTGNNQLPAEIPPDLVFDHHPLRKWTRSARFSDVRPDYGATATIVAEYLQASGLEPDKTDATAFVYALRAETQDFGREFAPRDKALYDQYLGRVDKRALGKIQNAPLPLSYFKNLHEALENLWSVDTLVISHLEEVEQPDIVPEIADLMLRMSGKTWSLSTGRYQGRVYLSIRTTNPRADAGSIMRRLVGKNGKGGGHGMTAGGWVQITAGYAESPRSLQEQLGQRLARALKKNAERILPVELGPIDAG